MSSARDAYDNRLCETYFATLEWELLERLRFATRVEARQAIVSAHRRLVQRVRSRCLRWGS